MNGALLMVARRVIAPGIVVVTQPGDVTTKTFRAYAPATGERLVAALLAVLDQFDGEDAKVSS